MRKTSRQRLRKGRVRRLRIWSSMHASLIIGKGINIGPRERLREILTHQLVLQSLRPQVISISSLLVSPGHRVTSVRLVQLSQHHLTHLIVLAKSFIMDFVFSKVNYSLDVVSRVICSEISPQLGLHLGIIRLWFPYHRLLYTSGTGNSCNHLYTLFTRQ